jgi:hypothetical protein
MNQELNLKGIVTTEEVETILLQFYGIGLDSIDFEIVDHVRKKAYGTWSTKSRLILLDMIARRNGLRILRTEASILLVDF